MNVRIISSGIVVLGITLLFDMSAWATDPQLTAGKVKATEANSVWSEFIILLQAGPIGKERLAPYREDLRAPMLGFLQTMRSKANWQEWRREPEMVRVGNQLHVILPLNFDGQSATYCFSFLIKGSTWFFQHLETITIRLDKLGPLPTRKFPDLPEKDKAWMREEMQVSKDVWMFNTIVAEKGRTAALNWFNDGAGYALAARAWVPFVNPARAFILYLCWEQANLRGNEVVLEQLDDSHAMVRLKPLCFALYQNSAHLKQQISMADYRALFEHIWQDRATNGGWRLVITYVSDECVLQFTRGM